jgi:hypothetical protein
LYLKVQQLLAEDEKASASLPPNYTTSTARAKTVGLLTSTHKSEMSLHWLVAMSMDALAYLASEQGCLQ